MITISCHLYNREFSPAADESELKKVDIKYGCKKTLDLTTIDPTLHFAKRGYASVNNKKNRSSLSYLFMGCKKAGKV